MENSGNRASLLTHAVAEARNGAKHVVVIMPSGKLMRASVETPSREGQGCRQAGVEVDSQSSKSCRQVWKQGTPFALNDNKIHCLGCRGDTEAAFLRQAELNTSWACGHRRLPPVRGTTEP